MLDEPELLGHVRRALAPELAAEELERLVVLRNGPARRRSSLYFVGTAGSEACRWVVKRPTSESQQGDLTSPLPADLQFSALTRLHDHLQRRGDGMSTPRPVALLPEIDAYVMEYVPGPTVTDLMRPRAVVDPSRLLAAVEAAGRLLQAVHALEPPKPDLIDLAELGRRSTSDAERVLRSSSLPVRAAWFSGDVGSGSLPGSQVLLHGDYAPENVVLCPAGVACLEPDLARREWPEHDVVRFLLMLADAPLFVTGTEVPPVARLRRRAWEKFLDAYYGPSVRPETLRPLLLLSLAARWRTRHTDVSARGPRLGRARQLLLRRHFTRLLDEVSAPNESLLSV